MRILFSKRNIIILIIAVLIASIAVISLNTNGSSGFVTGTAEYVTNPLKRIASSVARTFESIYGYMYEYDQLVQENEQLKRDIASLQLDYSETVEIVEENQRLRELVGLKERHSDWTFDEAEILQWSASNYVSSFTISKGSENSSIKVGDAIATEYGVLVGRVSAVGAQDSTCISIIDTTFSAAVNVGSLGATGTAHGEFSLMRDGTLRINGLTDDSSVFTGDQVVTSGRGGVLPEGLVLGTVTGVKLESSGIGVYAIVKPEAEFNKALYVYFVSDFGE